MLCNCLSRKHEVQLSKTEVNKDTLAVGLSAPQSPSSTGPRPPLKPLARGSRSHPHGEPPGAPSRPSPPRDVPPASPHACWGAAARLGWREGAAVLGARDCWFRRGKTSPATGARTTPAFYLLPTGGKAV